MKGYVNDIERIAESIGRRVSLFANIDPLGVLQNASEEDLEGEIRRQVAGGRKARGFLISPASPITPGTPLSRVRRFLEMGRSLGVMREGPTS
jgi:uroporphyrinogen-III decarboxylase